MPGTTVNFKIVASDTDAARVVSGLTNELIKLGVSADKTSITVKKVGVNAKEAAGFAQQFGDQAAKTRQNIEKMGDSGANMATKLARMGSVAFSVQQIISGLTAITGRFNAIVFDAVEVTAKFEQRMANVGTLMSTDVQPRMEALSAAALELSQTLGIPAEQLGLGTYQALSAGITDTTDAVQTLETAAKLSIGALGTMDESMKILAASTNAFGLAAGNITEVGNLMQLTVRQGVTTVGQLSQAFGAVGSVAAQAGITLREMQAATAALTTAGFDTATAQQNLRQAIVSLIAPNTKMIELFRRLGVESGLALIGTDGFVKGFQRLRQAAGDPGFLKEAIGRVQGFSAAMSLTGNQAEKFTETMKLMATEAGALEEAVALATDTIEKAGTRFQAAQDALKIEIGEEAAPVITSIADALTNLIQSMTRFLEQSGEIGSVISIVVGSIGAFVVVVGTAVTSLATWILQIVLLLSSIAILADKSQAAAKVVNGALNFVKPAFWAAQYRKIVVLLAKSLNNLLHPFLAIGKAGAALTPIITRLSLAFAALLVPIVLFLTKVIVVAAAFYALLQVFNWLTDSSVTLGDIWTSLTETENFSLKATKAYWAGIFGLGEAIEETGNQSDEFREKLEGLGDAVFNELQGLSSTIRENLQADSLFDGTDINLIPPSAQQSVLDFSVAVEIATGRIKDMKEGAEKNKAVRQLMNSINAASDILGDSFSQNIDFLNVMNLALEDSAFHWENLTLAERNAADGIIDNIEGYKKLKTEVEKTFALQKQLANASLQLAETKFGLFLDDAKASGTVLDNQKEILRLAEAADKAARRKADVEVELRRTLAETADFTFGGESFITKIFVAQLEEAKLKAKDFHTNLNKAKTAIKGADTNLKQMLDKMKKIEDAAKAELKTAQNRASIQQESVTQAKLLEKGILAEVKQKEKAVNLSITAMEVQKRVNNDQLDWLKTQKDSANLQEAVRVENDLIDAKIKSQRAELTRMVPTIQEIADSYSEIAIRTNEAFMLTKSKLSVDESALEVLRNSGAPLAELLVANEAVLATKIASLEIERLSEEAAHQRAEHAGAEAGALQIILDRILLIGDGLDRARLSAQDLAINLINAAAAPGIEAANTLVAIQAERVKQSGLLEEGLLAEVEQKTKLIGLEADVLNLQKLANNEILKQIDGDETKALLAAQTRLDNDLIDAKLKSQNAQLKRMVPTAQEIADSYSTIARRTNETINLSQSRLAVEEEELAILLIKEGSVADLLALNEKILQTKINMLEAERASELVALATAEAALRAGTGSAAAVQLIRDKINLLELGITRATEGARTFAKELTGASFNIGDSFKRAFEDLITGLGQGTAKIEDIFDNLKDSIIGSFTGAFAESLTKKFEFDDIFIGNIFGLGQQSEVAGEAIGQGLGGGFEGLLETFGNFFINTTKGIQGLGKKAFNFGKNLLGLETAVPTIATKAAPAFLPADFLSGAIGAGGILGGGGGAAFTTAGTAITQLAIPVGGYATVAAGGTLVSAGAAGAAGVAGAAPAAGGAVSGALAGISATGWGAIIAAAIILIPQIVKKGPVELGFGVKFLDEVAGLKQLGEALTSLKKQLNISGGVPSENDLLRKSIKQLITRTTGFTPRKHHGQFREIDGFDKLDDEALTLIKVLSVVVAGMEIFGDKARRVGITFDFFASQLVETFARSGIEAEQIAKDITSGLGLTLETAIDFFVGALVASATHLARRVDDLSGEGTAIQQLIEAQEAGISPTLQEGIATLIEIFAVDLPKALQDQADRIAKQAAVQGLRSLRRFAVGTGEDPTELLEDVRIKAGLSEQSSGVQKAFEKLLVAFEAGNVAFKGGGVAVDTADLLRVLRDVANISTDFLLTPDFDLSTIERLEEILGSNADLFKGGNRIQVIAEEALAEAFRSLSKRDLPEGLPDDFNPRLDELITQFQDGLLETVEEVLDILNTEFNLDLRIEDLNISGEDIVRRLQIEQEAFNALVTGFAAAAAVLGESSDIDKALDEFAISLGAQMQQRAAEGITKAFLQVADFDNIAGQLAANIDIGFQSIIEDFNDGDITSEEAGTAIDDLINSLGGDFEALAARAEEMGPIIERYAELQERILLAFTTFNQAADQIKTFQDNIQLLLLEFGADNSVAILEKNVLDAQDKANRKVSALTNTRGFGDISELSDEDLKRLVLQLDEAANAIAEAGRAEIAVLNERLRLTQQWIDLLPKARDILRDIRGGDDSPDEENERNFRVDSARLGALIEQFRTAEGEQKAAIAAKILDLAPSVLEAGRSAGLDISALEFILDSVLEEIVNRGLDAENEALDIQKEILAVQEKVRLQLEYLNTKSAEVLAELIFRGNETKGDRDDAEGPAGPPVRTATAAEGTFNVLNRGINVVGIKAQWVEPESGKHDRTLPGLPPLARGGIFMADEGPAMLHGPEAIIPLDRMREVLGSLPNVNPIENNGLADLVRSISFRQVFRELMGSFNGDGINGNIRKVVVNQEMNINFNGDAAPRALTPEERMLLEREQRRMARDPSIRALTGR